MLLETKAVGPPGARAQTRLLTNSLALGSSTAAAAGKAPGAYSKELHGLAPELEGWGGGSSLQGQAGWQKP